MPLATALFHVLHITKHNIIDDGLHPGFQIFWSAKGKRNHHRGAFYGAHILAFYLASLLASLLPFFLELYLVQVQWCPLHSEGRKEGKKVNQKSTYLIRSQIISTSFNMAPQRVPRRHCIILCPKECHSASLRPRCSGVAVSSDGSSVSTKRRLQTTSLTTPESCGWKKNSENQGPARTTRSGAKGWSVKHTANHLSPSSLFFSAQRPWIQLSWRH